LAINLFLQRHGVSLPSGRWRFVTDLLRGKGMASSTADIVATIRCLDAIFGTQSADIIPAILKEIERSEADTAEHHHDHGQSRSDGDFPRLQFVGPGIRRRHRQRGRGVDVRICRLVEHAVASMDCVRRNGGALRAGPWHAAHW
jgi:hypothetical protein